jgi:hypothetical protein
LRLQIEIEGSTEETPGSLTNGFGTRVDFGKTSHSNLDAGIV